MLVEKMDKESSGETGDFFIPIIDGGLSNFSLVQSKGGLFFKG
jgi:hypothetical protein